MATYRAVLEQAERDGQAGQTGQALATCHGVIRRLSPVAGTGNLSAAHRESLGHAYVVLGGVHLRSGHADLALDSCLRAATFVALPAPALAFAARGLAARKDQSDLATGIYLAYIRLQAGHPECAVASDPVAEFLKRRCSVSEGSDVAACHRARVLCGRVIEANDRLAWAHVALGLALAGTGHVGKAAVAMETAVRLEPGRQDALHYAARYRELDAKDHGSQGAGSSGSWQGREHATASAPVPDESAGPTSIVTTLPVPPASLPFSFGAAGVPVLWCLCHGRVGLGIAFICWNLVSRLLPASGGGGLVAGLIIDCTIMITMGFSGSRIAWEERGYASVEVLRQRERGWEVAGGIALLITVVLILVGLAAPALVDD